MKLFAALMISMFAYAGIAHAQEIIPMNDEAQMSLSEDAVMSTSEAQQDSSIDKRRPPRRHDGRRGGGGRHGGGWGHGGGGWGGSRYEWVYVQYDRNNGCQKCQYSCGASCGPYNVGGLMGCHVRGTNDDTHVYVCRRTR